MKISEITPLDVVNYLRLEDFEEKELMSIMSAAKAYIKSYTGVEDLDEYEDFWLAFMVLCQDMHDNRVYATEKSRGTINVNTVVDSILSLHMRGFL